MTQNAIQPLDHDIFLLDTGYVRPGLAASYLLRAGGRAAFVETGTNHSIKTLLAALAAQDIEPAAVDYVIVTHVHLDHAGGAGSLMAALPNARLVVHPRGARHMIDPTKLQKAVIAVYGAETAEKSYGTLLPVPAERVIEAPDGFVLEIGERALHFIDTPGHARHHFCVWDPQSRGIFSGDVFGLAYRELDTARGPLIFPSTSPSQFEPEKAKASIDRLMALGPERILLTHFGEVKNLAPLARDLCAALDATVEIGIRHRHHQDRHQRIFQDLADLLWAHATQNGNPHPREAVLALWDMDLELNSQGVEVWLDRQN